MKNPIGLKRVNTVNVGIRNIKYNTAGHEMIVPLFYTCADPEEGTGGPDPPLPPEKSQKYRVS